MKEFFIIFISVLLAEMADKTQLAIVCYATKMKPLIVWIASSSAFLVTNLIAVLVGCNLDKILPSIYIKYFSAAIFILVGIIIIISK
ncbi:MAG: TMEM165/GDT1 family protein [Endomicrobia bacterium]|nr:TMEM165/GDT1 family protein [Endomicrobiia bacterium]